MKRAVAAAGHKNSLIWQHETIFIYFNFLLSKFKVENVSDCQIKLLSLPALAAVFVTFDTLS
jgi:hypothetical protein